MTAAITEAMLPPPPDPLQEFIKVADMSTDVATRFMQAHQIVTIEDMLLFCPNKSQDLMKIYNGHQMRQTDKFWMDVQKKVAAFICWVHDIQLR